MTRRQRKRYRELIDQLSAMSHNGWPFAPRNEYTSLEAELRELGRIRALERSWAYRARTVRPND